MLINKAKMKEKAARVLGVYSSFAAQVIPKRVSHQATKAGGPPALGNWGAEQEL